MTLEHEEVREKLIAAALRLMDEGGLERVKARTVAGMTGVSVGTAYNLFGNVDGLIAAANTKIFGDLNALGLSETARIEAELRSNIQDGKIADSAEARTRYRLIALSRTYIGFVSANESRWAALLAFNRSQAGRNVGDSYLQRMEALIGIIGQVLGECPFAADTERRMLAARALWSAVHGIVTMNYVGQAGQEAYMYTVAQMDLIIDLFVKGAFAG